MDADQRLGVLLRTGLPLVLLGLVLFQRTLVHFRQLSPWKGGGFGMFSTVDSPSARVLRAVLVVSGQQVAVVPPGDTSLDVDLARTLPMMENMSRVAVAMKDRTWVPVRVTRAEDVYRARRALLDSPVTANRDMETPEVDVRRQEYQNGTLLPFYRPLEQGEGASMEALQVEAVEVVVYGAVYDGSTEVLSLRPLGSVRLAGPP